MVLLAVSMVMSGSGNLKVLQLCRFLHKRTFGEMNYGFHMAHHMALGLLFLGGGRLVEFEFHMDSESIFNYPALAKANITVTFAHP